jgi:hypothetical protein
MKTKERLVHFYDLRLETISLDQGISIPFSEDMGTMLTELSQYLKKGYEIGKNKNIEVSDFSYDPAENKLILLLNRPDADLSDVTYKDKKTKSRRNGNKTPTEAIEISSHVIITARLNSEYAEVKMTMGAGVYIERVVKLLNDLYDENKKTSKKILALKKRTHPTNAIGADNKPLTYQVNHRFEHRAHPNAWLKDILNSGEVSGLELIETGHHQFDTTQAHDIVRKTLKIIPMSSKWSIQSIRDLLPLAKKNHQLSADKIRIDYKVGSDKSDRTFALNELDSAFTKSERIELNVDHNQQQIVISSEIIAKMEAIS